MLPIKTNVIGVDEVGRGAWAGPLVVAAVMFRAIPVIPSSIIIRDSKTLSAMQREKAAAFIRRHADIAIIVASCEQVDSIGIQRANALAFQKAARAVIKKSSTPAEQVFVRADGRRICDFSHTHEFLIKGDQKCQVIAAASIVAKVWRDRCMVCLSKKYLQYGFERNKGYGTKEHQEALRLNGLSPIHRQSFSLACYTQ
ncbi:ribonuclease HII [Candidatus Uhrbacteria bacterium]|nr:ribonuclease HII [Candidatus Uhrbacteria bacterium]